MCLGIPGKVISIEREAGVLWGSVEFEGVQRRVCLECVPDVSCGEYVVVHAGLAISHIDEAEAARVFDLVRSMEDANEIR